jgi:ABC-type methionine transport system ATPase subunit
MRKGEASVRVHLTFPEELIREPVISRLVRSLDVEVNIRRANVDERVGWMICELDGAPGAVESAIRWLEEKGVEVNRLGDVVEG